MPRFYLVNLCRRSDVESGIIRLARHKRPLDTSLKISTEQQDGKGDDECQKVPPPKPIANSRFHVRLAHPLQVIEECLSPHSQISRDLMKAKRSFIRKKGVSMNL